MAFLLISVKDLGLGQERPMVGAERCTAKVLLKKGISLIFWGSLLKVLPSGGRFDACVVTQLKEDLCVGQND